MLLFKGRNVLFLLWTPPRVPPAEVGLLHTGLLSDHVLTLPSTTGVLLSP